MSDAADSLPTAPPKCKWTILARLTGFGRPTVLCRCECGTERAVREYYIRTGRSVCCGCSRMENFTRTTHGHAPSFKCTPEYECWSGIWKRCTNPKTRSFKWYGARGIKVCERWGQFENFLKDMGLKPSPKHTIERKDNNGDYEPGNCVWATSEENMSNKRTSVFLEYNGERLTVARWARKIGISQFTLYNRRRRGWPVEQILNTNQPPDSSS